MYEPLAIVGTACRFPGEARSASKLWDLLKAPRDVLKEFPPDRLHAANFYHENGEMHGRTNVRQKSYLLEEDIRLFDSSFFHINPKEAEDMDPQHRILLETVYEGFEAAGWPLSLVDGSQTSVHVGQMTDDYTTIQARDPDTLGSHAATGHSRAVLSNRVSYAFNLQGASITLDTACSSSLVALHLAAQGLHRGEATQAIVAGVNLLIDTHWYVMESSMHMLSPEARCRMWDKEADGYARGEGCAVLIIKTLDRAIRDGDYIECVIRSTGINSDGKTNGITMPSPLAQTSLIQQTYRAAGLDPLADRCQYFECHGTGTQAGDTVECQAIRDAFFPGAKLKSENHGDPLYCGSIKTVMGHLEGCAGLAGVMKASLAIQNKMIPPNMHFNQLNPKLEPFYQTLEVPTTLIPWPATHGGPRRASVNSFGFGGTNAHAILESYDSSTSGILSSSSSYINVDDSILCPSPAGDVCIGPFVFSAKSQASLVAWLKQFLTYLRENANIDLESLSYHLHEKRSVFSHRVAVPIALNRDDLAQKLEDQINTLKTSAIGPGARPAPAADEQKRFIGIFTGQGAQSARMGYALLRHCELFKKSITDCELILKHIPHPPSWSLIQELSANKTSSRVSEAEFSQPLCTAIQIGLVDLLQASGVRFSAVVGHSSGEIGAAYAAGLLTKKDAMGIAYYRGRVAHLAQGKAGEAGRMMAAAMSFDAATKLCTEKRFAGQVNVAASNSPSSVTLSGSEGAMDELKLHLDDIDVQARMLKVDVAYHSHHMLACAEEYLRLLKQLNIRIETPADKQACRWYSSVRTNTNILDDVTGAGLEGRYWLDNMVQPVLFSQAVILAAQAGTTKITAVIEVGPHPALKGPVNQTLKETIDYSPQYVGCLARDKHAVETYSEMLTAMWYLAPSSLDLIGWRKALGNRLINAPMVRDLPLYAWDHTKIHWRESRVARNYRLGEQLPHDILGRLWNDSQYEQTWRNIFQLNEMPWVAGHVFQDQVLFPATGYLSMSVDAAKAFVKGRPLKLVEVHHLEIPTALVIAEGDEVEIQFTIRSSVSPDRMESGSVLEADFVCYSYPDQHNASKTCHGQLLIHLGHSNFEELPPTYVSSVELTPLNVDRFYDAVSGIGFAYQGSFRALKTINRCWGHAKAVASWSNEELEVKSTLQPAVLDTALQTGLSTIISTAEGSMASAFLPVGIKRVLINPNDPCSAADGSLKTEMEAYMTSPDIGKLVELDINVSFKAGTQNYPCAVQMEGVRFQAISEPQPSEDRNILAKIVWDIDAAYGLAQQIMPEEQHPQLISPFSAGEYERVALFRLQSVSQMLKRESLGNLKAYHEALISYVDVLVAQIREDKYSIPLKEWLDDDAETINQIVRRHPDDREMMALISSGGSGIINNACNQHVARLMHQISHKYPRAQILEICAGTSNTTATVLDAVDDAYERYTCTGVSEVIVNNWKDKNEFAGIRNLTFKTLSIEGDMVSQGFEAGSYDVIVATDVFRSSLDLSKTAKNLRHLLRPGGFLVTTELTGYSLRPTATMVNFESWWVNAAGGPCKQRLELGFGEWDKLLVRSGFSGVDCALYDCSNEKLHGFSVLATQAMTEQLEILRDPINFLDSITPASLVLIGGQTSQVSKLIRQSVRVLQSWAAEIQEYACFNEVDCSQLPTDACVISFQDLDQPIFSALPAANELDNLKEVMENSQNVLWVTSRRLGGDPYANIMIGIGRALRVEIPQTNLHFLDFDENESWDVQCIVAKMLRLVYSSSFHSAEDMLWVEDPEVVIKDSQQMIARVVADPVANKVYNAKRRRVTRLVEPAEPIEILKGTTSETVLICSQPAALCEDQLAVQVELSVALHTSEEPPCFLCYGPLEHHRDTTVLTLSKIDSSVVKVSKKVDTTSVSIQGCNARELIHLANILIAGNVVANMPSNRTTFICGASEELADCISLLASAAGRKVIFIAITTGTPEQRDGWVCVHPKSTMLTIGKIMPLNSITDVLNLSQKDVDVISSWLPTGCTFQTLDFNTLSQKSIQEALQVYRSFPVEKAWPKIEPSVVAINEISQLRGSNSKRLSIVTNWKRDGPVAAIVPGLEPTALLSPNKTYFLVGMASELGQSLTYFMVRAGARHIVLSSRNPKADQQWIYGLHQAHVNIRVVKMDVTVRSQVRNTVAELRRTMPEIGGVTNAALVLDPGVFINLSAESIDRQLKPKVTGTANLDDEFKMDQLDFFIAFGSILTVLGNAGQPVYHAGNAYMASLVQNRRRRGLAASILNFGMLVDVGYVARSDRTVDSHVEEWLRNDIRTPLSEADFHHAILQGIVEGKPGSGSGEVIMGLETFLDEGKASRPAWADTAICSHMVRVSKGLTERQVANDAAYSTQEWQQRLEEASTVEQATPPITELLSAKIESMIRVSLHSIHPDEPMLHLGIDSINAIGIRKWFRESLGVDMPMLKILGRNSSASILQIAAQQYLAKRNGQGSASKPKVTLSKASKLTTSPAPAVSKATPKISSPSTELNKPKVQHENSGIAPQSVQSEKLSYPQAGFYYLSTISGSPTSFNLTMTFRITGTLHPEKFCRSFKKVVLQHDALRSAFAVDPESSSVMQYVTDGSSFQVTQVQSSQETAGEDWMKSFHEVRNHEYELTQGDVLKAILICHHARSHTLVIGFHNIAIDATSIVQLLTDIDRTYQSRPLSPSPTSYLDFTRKQLEDVRSGRLDRTIAFWKDLLDPIPESLNLLPMAKVKTRQINRTYGHHRIEQVLSNELVQRAKQISQANGATLMHFFLAVMQITLCRLLSIDSICIGIMHVGRDPESEFSQTIGHMANILPIPFRGLLTKSLPEILANTSDTLLACLDNANVPFAVISDSVRGRNDDAEQPLFQVAYDYRAGEIDDSSMGRCTITREEADFTSLYDTTIDVVPSKSNGTILSVRCTEDFYSLATTKLIADTFVNLFESMVEAPAAMAKDFRVFSNAQLQQAATVSRGPDVQHMWPQTLSARFEQVAAEFPNSVAVKDNVEMVTYSQLRQRVGTYAAILLEANVTAGARVAVFCEPSVDLYATMLAVFHLGAVFVPLDVSVPAQRRTAMIVICKPCVLAFHAATAVKAAEEHAADARPLNLTSLAQNRSSDPAHLPRRTVSDSRAESYILFTSGSTGVPKGIKLHQQGMMNYASHTSKAYGFKQIKVLQQTSIGFDLSFGQIYNALTNGGMLIAASVEARGDPDTLSRLIHDEKIEFTLATPSEYSLLLNYGSDTLKQCDSWRWAHTAGEALPDRLIEGMRDLKLPSLRLTDAYGPAEAFIVTHRDIQVHAGSSADKDTESGGTNIGHVLPNTSVYVVHEEDGSLLGVSLPGEICIAGSGVANGYLDASLNEAKFVPNPHATADSYYHKQGWTTMYKSGDRGLLRADGSVIFLGRTQGGRSMVKLRGLRIDLGEVAGAVLAAAPEDVADAAVTMRGDPQQFLVCHVVLRPGHQLDAGQLKAILGRLDALPRYMVPSAIVSLDRLPTTPNGKLDYRALETLPLPGSTSVLLPTITPNGQADGADEFTPMEKKLRAIWIDLIGPAARAEEIVPHSNFFAVGGSSLALVHLLHTVHRHIGVKVHLRVLRDAHSLRSMAKVIEKLK